MTGLPVTPRATYRVQVQPGFTFADTAAQVPYLAALGVSHLHLSPVLEAVPGSTHGYDVVDHSRVRAELGGEQGLRALSRTAREHGLGLILDIVPNHMAVPAPEHLNGPLWEVLRDGPRSAYADWFDIDWAALDGKVLLPVLGDPLPDVLGQLSIGTDKRAGGEVLRYYDHRFPLRPGTEKLPLPELVAAQWYRLAYWRQARTELNYRRFFTISDLIAIRVERQDVFDATHATVLRLLREGVADGLRIDHPDGLADPAGYLRRLAEASDGRWTVVEKILQRDEPLPADWACAGTTGYDALDRIDGVFTDPAGVAEVADFYRTFTEVPDDRGGLWTRTVRRAAYGVVTRDLAAEVSRLAASAQRAQRRGADAVSAAGTDSTANAGRTADTDSTTGTDGTAGTGSAADRGVAADRSGRQVRAERPEPDPYAPPHATAVLEEALRELLVRIPVYRPYVRPGTPATPVDTTMVTMAASRAAETAGPRLTPAIGLLRDLALGRPAESAAAPGEDADDFAVRFAQVASALHAKSVEDAAFYRYTPLLSLCEVGRDPGRPATTPEEFHAYCARIQRDHPGTGTVLSTHDTKRSADLRLRLAVLSELPDAWREWMSARPARAEQLDRAPAPDRHTEYTVFQTGVGLGFCHTDRLVPAALKAVREAGLRTSWTERDEAYEKTVADFAEQGPCGSQSYEVGEFVNSLGPYADANSLGAALLHLTMPGVPDVYQNTEFPVYTLVDPDNRGPMNGPVGGTQRFGVDSTLSGLLDGAAPCSFDEVKLRLTAVALRLRRDHPDWYGPAAAYAPLAAAGPARDHCLAFLRGGGALTVVTRLSRRLADAGGWHRTALPLPPGRWHDRLDGGSHEGTVPLAELLERAPVALLTRED